MRESAPGALRDRGPDGFRDPVVGDPGPTSGVFLGVISGPWRERARESGALDGQDDGGGDDAHE